MSETYDGPGNVSVTRYFGGHDVGPCVQITAPGLRGEPDRHVQFRREHAPGLIANLALALERPNLAAALDSAFKVADPAESLSFGLALAALRNGNRVARRGWNGKGMWLRLVEPAHGITRHDTNLPLLPYIELKTATDELVPWVASQTDVLALDWEVVG